MTAVTELLDGFERPEPTYGPVPIWWWSGAPLDNARLRWQMEQLTAQGVRQAVIMCLAPGGPVFGSVADDPPFLSEPWWQIFLRACSDARELGFTFWLYDQLGFSGANFQGRLVSVDPGYAGHALRRIETRLRSGQHGGLQCPAGGTPISGYFLADGQPDHVLPVAVPVSDAAVTWRGAPGRLVLVYSVRQGFDYFAAAAGTALVDMVLGEFERRAGQWFGDVIVGLFQDELPSMPTWGDDFGESFTETYGYDLGSVIGCLWEAGGREGEQVRAHYHAQRARLAQRGFFDPLAAWTRRTGVISGFDQQSPAREGDPAGGVSLYGDYLRTHSSFTAPGSDHWGDSKVHSSLAHAVGHPRTWLEAFHSSGWGGTLEETYDWLSAFLRRGATLYNPHAVYYATVSGWWEWAPPSTCWRQPYWPSYSTFASAVTRLCSLLSIGHLVADTVLLHPTVTCQSAMTLDGPLPVAARASELYHELNGVTAWFSEAPGILDRAAIDYEVFDDATICSGRVVDGAVELACGRFRNVVLPGAAVINGELADQLVDLAQAGGRVVCVGIVPRLLGLDDVRADRFARAVETGQILSVETTEEVPDLLVSGDLDVRADAPVLVRRHGDAIVLLLTSHDDRSGTQAPIIPGHRNLNWVEDSFRWDRYWTALAERGYRFVPVGSRRAHVELRCDLDLRAQQWDPRSGARTELSVHRVGDRLLLDVGFSDGPMSVVVLAADLPEADRQTTGSLASATSIEGPWRIRAASTLDNRWADLGDSRDRGVLPLQLWRFEHAVGPSADSTGPATEAGAWQAVVATFGPYVEVLAAGRAEPADRRGPVDSQWEAAPYSLSRGIYKDPLHFEYLGPKGMVPEEFLAWPAAEPDDWVAFRTHLPLLAGTGRHIVIGANADRRVFLDGVEAEVLGTGYWTSLAVGDSAASLRLEVWLRGDETLSQNPKDGPTTGIRASFAVVSDLDRYRRPEWLVPSDGSVTGTSVTVTTDFHLDQMPANAMIQVATEGPCVVEINGEQIGRQGAFEPYLELRQMRVHPYDAGPHVRAGSNTITLRIEDAGRPVATLVDSLPVRDGGIGLTSGLGWRATRDGRPVDLALRREQWTDPRWVCLFARAHPLPRAAWLDPATASRGVVLDLVPDPLGGRRRTEWLRFPAPAGTVSARVLANVPFTALLDGVEVAADESGTIRIVEPLTHEDTVVLRFDTDAGHSGGGLLRGPVTVELDEVTAPLLDWQQLGLRSLGGEVRYTNDFMLPAIEHGQSVWIDLGSVRGAAEVRVNDAAPKACIWSPYHADITADVVAGVNHLAVTVRGTLAGHLDDVSPTPAVAAGQTRSGLYGPVTVEVRNPLR